MVPDATLHLAGWTLSSLPVWTDQKVAEVVEVNMTHVLPAGM